ncbi:MAG TPA: NADH-quinone oxidoreductase subunit N [Candidatus Limnocylindria bacterium]|nr:NADH-quinone oxidoreductase subunit N [Candidatus Limnocylindria bacterium]
MNYLNDLFTLLPELILVVTVLAVITADLFLPRQDKWLLTPLTIFGLILAGIGCVLVWGVNDTSFDGFYRVDDLSVFLKMTTMGVGILSALFVPSYLRQRRLPLGEFNTLLLFSLIGMCVLASSSDLITLFIGLELMVMPGYLLTGFAKTDRYSNEGGLKYFLLGSFASAILLFGVSWTYGLTGTTRIDEIARALTGASLNPAMLVAIGMLTVGATFKVAAVPFHYWTPDAYQGAPTPITGYLSVGPKLGAFALLIRVFAEALGPVRSEWLVVMAILAVLTMTGGNIVALVQANVKRMLAYSAIAHSGYILAGLAAFAAAGSGAVQQQAIESILFYLAGYALMNIAAFAVVGMLQRDASRFGGLASFAGLASRAPGRAAAMAILLLSLTGIPPTVGFFAKWYVLLATVNAGLAWLAVAIVLNAAMAAFYYLRVIVYMYMREPEAEPAPIDRSGLGGFALALSVIGVVLLGIFPGVILDLLKLSAGSLF